MKSAFAPALFVLVLALPHLAAPATAKEKEKSHEESLLLFDQRRVGVNVPAGFLYSASKDEHGVISARLSTPKDTISLQISFLPDIDGEYATARGQKEIMVKSFQQYVVGSVEQGMHFEELQPRNGSGTYCIFTDAKLVGAATPGPKLVGATPPWPKLEAPRVYILTSGRAVLRKRQHHCVHTGMHKVLWYDVRAVHLVCRRA
jgi:hypothetical protein